MIITGFYILFIKINQRVGIIMLFFSLLVGFVISLLATYVLIKSANKINALDYPTHRGMNKAPIPTMGGIAIYLALLVVLWLNDFLIDYPAVIISMTILVLLGIIDDFYQLSAIKKLIGQFLCCLIPLLAGEINLNLRTVFFRNYKFILFSIILLGLIYLINSINFIDGVDGLAGGVGIIIALAIACLAYLNGQSFALLLSLALIAGVAGFIPYNYNPAQIFMGDTGSMLIGFVLGIAAIKAVAEFSLLKLILLAVLFLIPFLDTAIVMLKRKLAGQSIFTADKKHLHHCLLDLGYSQKKVVYIICLASILLVLFALAFKFANSKQFLFLLSSLIFYIISFIITINNKKKQIKN